jgi:filamentous hemagglutinin family protein
LSPECYNKRIYSERAGHILADEGRVAMRSSNDFRIAREGVVSGSAGVSPARSWLRLSTRQRDAGAPGWFLKNGSFRCRRGFAGIGILLLAFWGNVLHANPTGGTVTQGSATFNTSGSQFTINQTSANAFINWTSFNIAAGETTTFNQPSATSVTWNYINDPNASSVNGNINAIGYVILQNPNGFNVGGQASIAVHGLVMTTASTPALNLSSGGPWSFNAPPPTAKIINYGQINIAGGGSAFLIASDIENHGTISAPGGNIGLYAGQTVLVSTSPDGRALSAQVTLPQGSVDNEGKLIADGGSIVAQAQLVNQNGLIQANSAQNVNGTIELVASGSQSSLNLGASSVISANGDSTASSASPGGFVVLNAGNNTFADTSGSTISVSGAAGGQNGVIEIFGNGVTAGTVQSTIGSYYAYLINPGDIFLSTSPTTPNTVIPSVGDTSHPNPYANLNVGDLSAYSQIDLQALDNITLSSTWTLADQTVPANLSLSAGNDITLNSSLSAGNNWNVNLTAGTAFVPTQSQPIPNPGNDGIYVNGSLQTLNGDITLDAANEVIVGTAVRTIGGGNINVTAQHGDVNSGTSVNGFNYLATATAPYYTPFQVTGSGTGQKINYNQSNLGGISTAAGGNVTINAGGDVISFPTTTVAAGDPGTGAFGPEPGNVTINAGGSVYGCYVVMNGAGTITAGQDIGTLPFPSPSNPNADSVALSLAKGSWNLDAQGNIYLQEVRNPNGVFNNKTTISGQPTAGYHLFDYDPQTSVTLTAGNGVYLTGYDLPRPNGAVSMLLPPTLIINAGPGGVVLQTPTAVDSSGNSIPLLSYDITLFPSAYGNLQITTTDGGGLSSGNADGTSATLLMSDSAQTRWPFNPASSTVPFGENDHASVPAELNNPDPVVLNISGNMENVILQVSKFAQINVGGDMIGCTFFGENLQANQVTSISVGGQIYNAVSFTSVTLNQTFPSLPSYDLPPGDVNSLFQILELAVNPVLIANLSAIGIPPSQLASYLQSAYLFRSLSLSGLSYDPNTQTLTAGGPLSGGLLTALTKPTLTFVVYGPNGEPEVDSSGHFVTDTITWTPANSPNYSLINSLYTESQQAPVLGVNNGAYVVGGTGAFDITANSISLGNSLGILSVGAGTVQQGDYSFLAPYITSGATINVTVLGQQQTVNKITGETGPALAMPASTIAALGGGDVNVTCEGEMPNPNGVGGVSMDLGSQDLADFEGEIMNDTKIGLGIYTTGGGNVNVIALGDINIDTSRIGTFNGGDVFVESQTGNVNAGNGGSTFFIPIHVFSPDASAYNEEVFANGIAAETLLDPSQIPGSATVPGNITVFTPQGDIIANEGGIKQEALNGTAPSGPTITLTAGTPLVPGDFLNLAGPPLYVGNIDLGTLGAIGETVIAQATGNITGKVVSRHNATITSQTVGSLLVVAGGTPTISARGSDSLDITIVGGQGANVNGLGPDITIISQNASVNGGAATSTMGTSATATAASQSAAGQASSQTQQQVASNDNGNDDEKKKKTELLRSVGRVTVILPKAS